MLNVAAADCLGERFVLLDTGVVARRGRGIILPADAESGKSTLVAGLVAHGFQYLSDDVALIEIAAGEAFQFVKASSCRVSLPSFPELTASTSHRRPGREQV